MARAKSFHTLETSDAGRMLFRFAMIGRAIALGLLLAGCGGDGSDPPSESDSSPDPGSPPPGQGSPPPGEAANHAPTIGGAPPGSVSQGSQYRFVPSANDADGDALTFGVDNRPPWTEFDAASGEISGVPGPGDVGVYADITITVSDGSQSVSLPAFSVDVVATAAGTVTLSWVSPTRKADGSPLSDLAGFKVYWGQSEGQYSSSVTIDNPGLTRYVIDELTPATWYFVATAFDSAGNESSLSNVASKTIL
jgi:hypothetical protein